MTQSRQSSVVGVPWYQRAGVWIGIGTGPGTFTVGGVLSANFSLLSLLFIIPIGVLSLVGLTVAQAYVSRRRRESSTERAVGTFGENLGAVLLNLIVALGTVGWFSFYTGLAGFAAGTLLNLPGWVGSLLVAVGLYIVNAMGLNRWNALVWLTALSTIGVALFAFFSVGTQWASDPQNSTGISEWLWGIGNVITYGLLFALRVGDFAWDLERDEDVFKAGLALFIPMTIFIGIGALVYRAVGDWNIADVLARRATAALGNIFLIISVIAPSMSGFHSGSLAIPTFTPLSKRASNILIAVLGFVLGALRFDRQLLLFLDLLGAFIMPALVVMLITAFVAKPINLIAILAAWFGGSGAALFAKWQGTLSPVFVGVLVCVAILTISTGWTRWWSEPLVE